MAPIEPVVQDGQLKEADTSIDNLVGQIRVCFAAADVNSFTKNVSQSALIVP